MSLASGPCAARCRRSRRRWRRRRRPRSCRSRRRSGCRDRRPRAYADGAHRMGTFCGASDRLTVPTRAAGPAHRGGRIAARAAAPRRGKTAAAPQEGAGSSISPASRWSTDSARPLVRAGFAHKDREEAHGGQQARRPAELAEPGGEDPLDLAPMNLRERLVHFEPVRIVARYRRP